MIDTKKIPAKKFLTARAFFPALPVLFLRIAAGFSDGSSLLALFGIWGLYSWACSRWGRPEGEAAGDAGRIKLFCVFSLVLAAFSLGMLLEGTKEIFRLRMGMELKLPGPLSLVTIIVTALLWEGGVCFSAPDLCGGRAAALRELCLALGVFLLLAAYFSWGQPWAYIETAGGLFFALAVLARSVSWLLGAGSLLLNQRRDVNA